MLPILPTGNVPETNQDGPHGKGDPANNPGAKFEYVSPVEEYNPMNANFLSWRKPGTPGNG